MQCFPTHIDPWQPVYIIKSHSPLPDKNITQVVDTELVLISYSIDLLLLYIIVTCLIEPTTDMRAWSHGFYCMNGNRRMQVYCTFYLLMNELL